MSAPVTADTVTDGQIRRIGKAARDRGDYELWVTCEIALEGAVFFREYPMLTDEQRSRLRTVTCAEARQRAVLAINKET